MNDQVTNSTNSVVNPSINTLVDNVEIKFNFKKTVVEGIESKRPSLTLALPLISMEGAVEAFNAGGKQLELVLEALRDIQISRAREIINENEAITAETFPYSELSWEKIANLPKADRRGGGISKETWEEFSKDYIAIMPSVTGKSAEQVGNAAKILLNKFNAVKTAKPIISLLLDQLGMYVTNSPNAEQFVDCVEFLQSKGKALLAVDEATLLANL